MTPLKEACTHKSAKTHADIAFLTRNRSLLTLKCTSFQDSWWNISTSSLAFLAPSVCKMSFAKQTNNGGKPTHTTPVGTGNNTNKHVRLRGLTYIHTCRSYVHTLRELDRHAVESPTGIFIGLHALADSSDFGLLRKQSSPKWEIPCPGHR